MKLTLDLPGTVRVAETSDYKGNPLTVLLISDTEVLYAEGHEPGGLDAGSWEDVFRTRLARIFATLLLDGGIDAGTWHRNSPTGRETWGPESSAYEVRMVQEDREG
jgi:hypothetical protein